MTNTNAVVWKIVDIRVKAVDIAVGIGAKSVNNYALCAQNLWEKVKTHLSNSEISGFYLINNLIIELQLGTQHLQLRQKLKRSSRCGVRPF